MSKIANKLPPPPASTKNPKPTTAQKQEVGQKSFAVRMRPKQDAKKTASPSSSSSSSTVTQSHDGTAKSSLSLLDSGKKQSPSSLMMQRQGTPVLSRGRGGTVADLQAQLEPGSGAAKGLSKGGQAVVDQQGQGQGLGDMKSLGKDMDKGIIDPNNAAAAGAQGLQAGVAQGPQGGTVIQVQGNRVPTAMLDKMVEHCRVGVNAAGATEFQMELKGDVLGGLKMRLSMEDGGLKAIFVAENADVRKFIDGNLQDLKRALEDKGIQIKDLEARDPKEDERERKREQNQKERQEAFSQD